MGKALYRKYRSRSLSELVGQEHITDTLDRAIKAGRVSHAYLFTGPRGVGKTSVARILAHEINNIPYADTQNLDIIEIDAASNRRIDDIRDLREKVHIAPVKLPYKVYIIDEVHMLTGESFNALLKTLEEPPSHVVFILATTEFHKLPATIVSRTQRFSFRPGTPQNMVPHLRKIADAEKISIDDAALELIAEYSDGGFRDANSLLDQLAHISTGTITAADVATTLGLAPKDEIKQLFEAWKSHDAAVVVKSIGNLHDKGVGPSSIVDQLAKEILSQPLDAEPLRLLDALLDVPRAYNPSLKLIATLTANQSTPAKETMRSAPALVAAPVTIAKVEPPKPKTESSNPTTLAQEKQKPAAAHDHVKTMSTEDWSRVMLIVQKKDPPVFAALKKGQPFIDGDMLIIKFKNSFMAKKLDSANQKAVISECVQTVLGIHASIEMVVDKDTVPAVISDNPHISSITNIMGGGELIDAPAL
jgi:DNA polymerase III subunit gamma/tau